VAPSEAPSCRWPVTGEKGRFPVLRWEGAASLRLQTERYERMKSVEFVKKALRTGRVREPTTVRAMAWEALERQALELRQSDPGLTKAASVSKALDSEKGRVLYELYSSPAGDLSPRSFVSKVEREERLGRAGHRSWGHSVVQAASRLNPEDPKAGMEVVRRRYPTLWAAYERELGER